MNGAVLYLNDPEIPSVSANGYPTGWIKLQTDSFGRQFRACAYPISHLSPRSAALRIIILPDKKQCQYRKVALLCDERLWLLD